MEDFQHSIISIAFQISMLFNLATSILISLRKSTLLLQQELPSMGEMTAATLMVSFSVNLIAIFFNCRTLIEVYLFFSFSFFFAGSAYLLPGATVATILMLGALHARRLYDDRKVFSLISIFYLFSCD